jgi:DNA invertase Pin-like site-specific DNA recombinase
MDCLWNYPDYLWCNLLFFKAMKFVIYARKSTESEDRQALSIQSQIFEMQEIAKRENLKIVEILQESKSAKQPGRPIFNQMIEKFKSGKYDGILCWKIDRLARNSLDAGMVQWLLEKDTIKQIKTFERDYNPSDNVVMASIEFSMANQYVRDLSKNVKRGQAEKIRRGEYPATPPVGYLLDYKTKKIYIDEDKWQHIKKAFRLYATGNYSISSLAEKLSKEGFRSRNGRPVHGSGIYQILNNPIFYGWFSWNNQIYKGIHTPIISKDLFDAVQEVFHPMPNMPTKSSNEAIRKLKKKLSQFYLRTSP